MGAPSLPPPPAWLVLVVDDDPSVLEVTKLTLERMKVAGRGLELECARSAAEARDRLHRRRFALAIVDVVMESERAGLELVKDLRSDPRHRITQVVVRTGEPGAYPEARVMEDFEVSDYWPKAELRPPRMRAAVMGLIRAHATALELEGERARLEAAVAEAQALLKEVHHRVKNNLQVVSSLLMLQAEEAPGVSERTYLVESAGRIRSMALVHQHLYGEATLSRIDFGRYAEALVRGLADAVTPRPELSVSVEAVELGIEQAVPCALILNELVGDALVRGRRAGAAGTLAVTVRRRETGLTVEVEAPEALVTTDGARPGALGQRLLRALVRQLRGDLEALGDGRPGVRFECPLGGDTPPASGARLDPL
jgi:two-component sensor histidine kinase